LNFVQSLKILGVSIHERLQKKVSSLAKRWSLTNKSCILIMHLQPFCAEQVGAMEHDLSQTTPFHISAKVPMDSHRFENWQDQNQRLGNG
jgi:hypothetical protein